MKFIPLQERLRGPIANALMEKLGVKNTHALPRITKVTVNVGINKTKMEGMEMHEYVAESLKLITGQKPAFRTSRKSISNFKIREGTVVGAQVTLHGKRMGAFLDKLIHIALPRVRDFRGLQPRFDGHGNFSIGLREHTVFPEIPPPDPSKVFGLEVTLTLSTDSDAEAEALLREMGMPFRKEKEKKEKNAQKEDD